MTTGRPLISASIPGQRTMTPAVRPRTNWPGSGFFLLGIIEEPVENASATRTNPNRGFDHQVISSARRERWTIARATAAGPRPRSPGPRPRRGVRGHAVEAEPRGRRRARSSGSRHRPRRPPRAARLEAPADVGQPARSAPASRRRRAGGGRGGPVGGRSAWCRAGRYVALAAPRGPQRCCGPRCRVQTPDRAPVRRRSVATWSLRERPM